MNLKLYKLIRELYEFLNKLDLNFCKSSLEKKFLLKKYIHTNNFLSKNILSFVNNIKASKQITGLSLKSYINLLELILIFRRFLLVRKFDKFNFSILIFRVVLFFHIAHAVLKKIYSFFFLNILISGKNIFLLKKNKVYLSFNFPQHSFKKRKLITYPSSFYENIICKEKKNLSFLTFNSFPRISKENFFSKKIPNTFEVNARFSVYKFFIYFFLFFKSNNKFYQKSLPFEINLLNFLNLLNAHYYEMIIKSIETNYDIHIKRVFFFNVF